MDLPQSTPQNEAVFNYEQMDFSHISSDLPDIMTMTSDADIPDLDDDLDAVWFAWTISLTLPKSEKASLYIQYHTPIHPL